MAEARQKAQDGHTVSFRSWNPYMPRDMAEGARDRPIEAQGTLYLPAGEAPPGGWPGVVIAQGLGGPMRNREMAYGRWLAEHGHATLVLDSYASRNIRGPETWKALRLTTAMVLADAFGALAYLGSRPEIDGERVAIKGYSYGGMVSQVAAFEPIRDLYQPEGGGFAAHIAYYSCSVVRMKEPETTGAPVLIMIGERDRNVSVERTQKIAEDLRRGGSDVRLKVFDCYHQWDGDDVEPRRFGFHLRHCHVELQPDGELRVEESGRKIDGPLSRLLFLATHVSSRGYTIQKNREVTRRSNAEVLDFLDGLRRGPISRAGQARRAGQGR
ncbi:dienelactone hydrolase family protein [Minwuia thermotolerans]|nr:dienelactone hydrolase family protein [Minwuia thermotolerans]